MYRKNKINNHWLTPKFTGYGAGNNPTMGSNSAYIMTPDDGMILLECGETVFARMINLKDFQRAQWLTIIVSHTHSDHAGSLGNMVLYNYQVLNRPVTIIAGGMRQKSELRSLLKAFGVPRKAYCMLTHKDVMRTSRNYARSLHLCPLGVYMPATSHVPELACHSVIMTSSESVDANKDDDQVLFWSGDTNDPFIGIYVLKEQPNMRSYVEVCGEANPYHTSLDEIEYCLDLMTQDDVRAKWRYRKQITLMHFDSEATLRRAEKLGYSIPKLVTK